MNQLQRIIIHRPLLFMRSALIRDGIQQLAESIQSCSKRLRTEWEEGKGTSYEWELEDVVLSTINEMGINKMGIGTIRMNDRQTEHQQQRNQLPFVTVDPNVVFEADLCQAAVRLQSAVESMEMALLITTSVCDKFGNEKDVCVYRG